MVTEKDAEKYSVQSINKSKETWKKALQKNPIVNINRRISVKYNDRCMEVIAENFLRRYIGDAITPISRDKDGDIEKTHFSASAFSAMDFSYNFAFLKNFKIGKQSAPSYFSIWDDLQDTSFNNVIQSLKQEIGRGTNRNPHVQISLFSR